MQEKKKVLIAAPVHHILIDWLKANGYACIVKEQITQAEALAIVADCAGIVTSTRLILDKALIDAAPRLQWIGRMGSGMEIIDVGHAMTRGIQCFSSPEGNRNAVAEHALGMLLSLNKRIVRSNNEVRQGIWLRDANRGVELEGKTIGIIGFGNTGRELARKLQGFDMQILVYDKYCNDDIPEYVVCCEDLERIYKEADIISFHVPLQADTIHYFNNIFIEKMRKPFVVINTSRGDVVDAHALEEGLSKGIITGACIDVWEHEPLNAMSVEQRAQLLKIANFPQVIVTPHIAGYSYEAIYKMSKVLLNKIVTSG